MPRLIPFRLAAACALAADLLFSLAQVAAAKGSGRPTCAWSASGGKVLAEESFGRRRSRGQDQLQGDLLRPGHRRQRQGGRAQRTPTALGMLVQAAEVHRRRCGRCWSPTTSTSASALCGIGGSSGHGRSVLVLQGQPQGAQHRWRKAVKVQRRRRSALGPGAVLSLPGRAGAERARTRSKAGKAVHRCASSPTTKRGRRSPPPA